MVWQVEAKRISTARRLVTKEGASLAVSGVEGSRRPPPTDPTPSALNSRASSTTGGAAESSVAPGKDPPRPHTTQFDIGGTGYLNS